MGKNYSTGIWGFWVFNGIIKEIWKLNSETKMLALSQKKTPNRRSCPRANNAGFTIIELMVVVTIMALMASVMVLNLNTTRASRDIKIAQNLLVSNLRKTQSYTLSSRNLASGQQVQYYLMKFDITNNPTQYVIQAVYDVDSLPKLEDNETISLPPNIKIASVEISERTALPSLQKYNPSPSLSTFTSGCGLISFAAPFGKVIFNDGCTLVNPITHPYDLGLSDDYYSKILSFQINVPCDVADYGTPGICTASTDSVMVITLSDLAGSIFRKVLVNGITGAICPTLGDTSPPICQTSG